MQPLCNCFATAWSHPLANCTWLCMPCMHAQVFSASSQQSMQCLSQNHTSQPLTSFLAHKPCHKACCALGSAHKQRCAPQHALLRALQCHKATVRTAMLWNATIQHKHAHLHAKHIIMRQHQPTIACTACTMHRAKAASFRSRNDVVLPTNRSIGPGPRPSQSLPSNPSIPLLTPFT